MVNHVNERGPLYHLVYHILPTPCIIIVTYDLATPGVRASATILFTMLSRIKSIDYVQ